MLGEWREWCNVGNSHITIFSFRHPSVIDNICQAKLRNRSNNSVLLGQTSVFKQPNGGPEPKAPKSMKSWTVAEIFE